MSTSSKYLGARRKLREKRKCTGLYSESSIDTADNEEEMPPEMIGGGGVSEITDTNEDANLPEISFPIPAISIPIPISSKDNKNSESEKSLTPSPPSSLKSALKNGNSKTFSPAAPFNDLSDQVLNESLKESNQTQPTAVTNTTLKTTVAQLEKNRKGIKAQIDNVSSDDNNYDNSSVNDNSTAEEANSTTVKVSSKRHQYRYPRSQTIPLLIRDFANRQIFTNNNNNKDISDDEALTRDSNEFLSMNEDSHNYRLKTPFGGKRGSGDVTPTYVDIIEKLTKSLEDEKEANAFLNQELMTSERRIKNLENEVELLKMEIESNKKPSESDQ